MSNWEQTKWIDETGKLTVTIQVDLALQDPDYTIVSLEIRAIDHIPSVPIQEEKLENADLSFPIIVVEKDEQFQMILDGHHRRYKAMEENRTHILAKVLRNGIFK